MSGTSTPSPRTFHFTGTHNEDSDTLVSALHAAFLNRSPFHAPASSSTPSSSQSIEQPPVADSAQMYPKDKSHHMGLDISLATDVLVLKGTGADVEPALLSGNLVLYLTEPTSIKDINLQFRGKARLPVNPNDPHVLGHSPSVFGVCQHDWSFLEGGKRHSHTLKPGRHFFPFQLSIGGALPSTIESQASGGASVLYKLRATAVRPGFATNLSATCPVTILRSFTSAALEYQQTLEIENTWPGKLMYSLVLPHKAWAAGDDLTTLVKFSPITKGVRVVSVTTVILETTKTFTRTGGHLENTRALHKTKHVVMGGRVVPADENIAFPWNQPSRNSPASSTPATPSHSDIQPQQHASSSSESVSAAGPSVPRASLSRQSSSTPVSGDNGLDPEDFGGETEVSGQLILPIPKTMTPSHTLDPIIVSHRIRWSVMIANADGHTSELRCSLPLFILDHALLHEARSATAATRRLLLGGPEPSEEEEQSDLPSYPSHVRDRVANMFLQDSATLRVTNPWVHNHVDPIGGVPGQRTPPESIVIHMSPHSDAAPSSPLDWVNSELVMSLNGIPGDIHYNRTPPESLAGSHPASHRESRHTSTTNSTRTSRSGSPERSSSASISSHASSAMSSGIPSVARADETHVHASNPSSRQNHGLFEIHMKPLSSIPHLHLHSTTHHSHLHSGHNNASHGTHSPGHESPRSMTMPPSGLGPSQVTQAALLHRAFTEVPTYDVASRGFLGGGPPSLETMRGLPSYEEAHAQ